MSSTLDVCAGPVGETEGVTKFRLDFKPGSPAPWSLIAPLNAWRSVLHRLGLVAQDPERYEGIGFGNVSVRSPADKPAFWISGTQTGHIPVLDAAHYCGVLDYDLCQNSVSAEGSIPPSSESLTHAALYHADPDIRCVLHVHSPELWRQADYLGIPIIDRGIAYGTPDMAEAVGRLAATMSGAGILAMAGHPDGIVAFGTDVDDTATALITRLARALERETALAGHDAAT